MLPGCDAFQIPLTAGHLYRAGNTSQDPGSSDQETEEQNKQNRWFTI